MPRSLSRPEPRSVKQFKAEELYQHAVKLLARRGRSRAELSRLLAARAADAASLEPVLARLAEHGYLDDKRFAEGLARFQHDQEKFGAQRAARELRRRGLAEPVANAALRQVYRPRDEASLLAAYLRKKRLTAPGDPRAAARLFRRLRLAGFTSPAICDCLRRWRLDSEWIEAIAESAEENPEEEEG